MCGLLVAISHLAGAGMSRTVVTTIADSRPMQSGLDTEALPFGAFMDVASVDQLQIFLGESLAFTLGLKLGTEVRLEPAADPVKVAVPDAALPISAPRVRQ